VDHRRRAAHRIKPVCRRRTDFRVVDWEPTHKQPARRRSAFVVMQIVEQLMGQTPCHRPEPSAIPAVGEGRADVGDFLLGGLVAGQCWCCGHVGTPSRGSSGGVAELVGGLPAHDVVAQHQSVDSCRGEGLQRVSRAAHDGLAVVERRVEQHRHPGPLVELGDQRVVAGIGRRCTSCTRAVPSLWATAGMRSISPSLIGTARSWARSITPSKNGGYAHRRARATSR
jgi:hypothetical protein